MTAGTITSLFPTSFSSIFMFTVAIACFIFILILAFVLLASMSDTVYRPKLEPIVNRNFKVRGMLYSDVVWVELGNNRIFIYDQDDSAGSTPIGMFTVDAQIEARRIGSMLHRGVNVPCPTIRGDKIIYPVNQEFYATCMLNRSITTNRLPLGISAGNAHVAHN